MAKRKAERKLNIFANKYSRIQGDHAIDMDVETDDEHESESTNTLLFANGGFRMRTGASDLDPTLLTLYLVLVVDSTSPVVRPV